jgi:hypothetical protein
MQCPIDAQGPTEKVCTKKALAGEIKTSQVSMIRTRLAQTPGLIESDRERGRVWRRSSRRSSPRFYPPRAGHQASPAGEEAIKSRLKDLGPTLLF